MDGGQQGFTTQHGLLREKLQGLLGFGPLSILRSRTIFQPWHYLVPATKLTKEIQSLLLALLLVDACDMVEQPLAWQPSASATSRHHVFDIRFHFGFVCLSGQHGSLVSSLLQPHVCLRHDNLLEPIGNLSLCCSAQLCNQLVRFLQQLISRLFCGYDRFQLLDTKVHDLVRALRPRVFTSFTYPTVKRDPRPLASVSVLDLP
mmetsp:Transcript_49120/g.110123  ORF Transcript_49120/g.110123 Transcript_49120/m.110123 type:complete len:203 (+) Transcript_49120:1020-1628(+)